MQGIATGYQAFRLKGTMQAVSFFCIRTFSFEALKDQLQHNYMQAPRLMEGALVAIDFAQHPELFNADQLLLLLKLMAEFGLHPIGFVNATEKQTSIIKQATNLSALQNQKSHRNLSSHVDKIPTKHAAKIISGPVRSGQQVSHTDGDLIILGNVNPGGEVLAKGHIHIYGQLFGRAMAGFNGDHAAKIFCSHLQAQIVSIAGVYRKSEDNPVISKACMIEVVDKQLMIHSL